MGGEYLSSDLCKIQCLITVLLITLSYSITEPITATSRLIRRLSGTKSRAIHLPQKLEQLKSESSENHCIAAAAATAVELGTSVILVSDVNLASFMASYFII